MIREIEKPKIDFKFWIDPSFKFYYDKENGEYFIETEHGSKFYFNLKGNLHRIGKPAFESYNGEKRWRENGKVHRLDGPSYVSYSYKFYFINDKYYSEKEFTKETKHLVCGNCGSFCKQECFI